jgi:hypothetical protein
MSRSSILAALASWLTPDGAGNVLANQSPAQFDNSLRLATMAALKVAGNQASGITPFNANTGLTAAHMGGVAYAFGPSALFFNLPQAGSLGFPLGSQITILNASAAALTVTAVGSDHINFGTNQTTNAIIQPGDSVTFTWNATSWFATGGSAMMAFSGLFAASLVQAAGYQKLPNGMIVQWGISQSITNGVGAVSVNYPLAFSNGPFVALAGYSNSGGGSGATGNPTNTYVTASKSQFAITNSGTGPAQYNFIALGF